MSMSIARAKYTGDPGFFDFVKKIGRAAIGSIPVVGTALSQLIPGGGRQPAMPTSGPGGVPLTYTEAAAGGYGSMVRYRQDRVARGINGGEKKALADLLKFQVDPLAILPGGRPFTSMMNGGTAMVPYGGGMMGGPGYHLNKSNYFLMSGEFIAAGTRWVKNRKRNPANARATSRSIARIKGAKKYTASLSQISIRKKC